MMREGIFPYLLSIVLSFSVMLDALALQAGFVGRMGPNAGGQSYWDASFLRGDMPGTITFIRASQAGYFDTSCLSTTAATNQPRFDYRWNASTALCEPQGLLIEGQRTNTLLYSQNFAQAGTWSRTGANSFGSNDTGAAGAGSFQNTLRTLDPFGANNAAFLQESSAAGAHNIAQISLSITSGATYTDSFSVKAAGRDRVSLSKGVTAFGTNRADFNLSAGTFIVAGNTVAGMQAYPNGWWFIWAKDTAVSTTTSFSAVSLLDGANSASYTGDNTSGIFVIQAQREVGAFPSSPIPTEASQATRAADAAIVTNLASMGFKPLAGTLVAEFTLDATMGTRMVARFDDGTNNNQIRIATSGGLAFAQVITGGSLVANLEMGAISAGTHRIAFTFAENDFAASLNGGAPLTDTSGAIPAGLTRFRIGSGLNNDELYGNVRRLVYYPSIQGRVQELAQ